MRCYFLTEAAEQRPDAATLDDILRRINVSKFHWRRDFAPTKRNRRAQKQQFHQPLRRIPSWGFGFQGLPHAWRNYFAAEPVLVGSQWLHEWRFRWPELFELRVVSRLILEMHACDLDGDSRLAELDAIFNDPRRHGKLCKLVGRRRGSAGRWRQEELEKMALKRMRAALAGDVEAEKAAANLMSSLLQHFPRFL